MKPQVLLFWIVVAVLVVSLIMLFTNQILYSMLVANVKINP